MDRSDKAARQSYTAATMHAPSTPRHLVAALLLAAVSLGACAPAAADVRVASEPSVQPTTVPTQAQTTVPTVAPTVVPTATAVPTPPPTPVPDPQPFAMNLFQDGDFVPQHTFDWCVGASIQMAWNMVRPQARNSYGDQQKLWEMARARSTNSFNGANPHGWASVLTEIGLGPYSLVSIPTYEEALRTAAAALRATNRPVGLVMWRGRHAWVMSGFESVGDPAIDPDVTVTGIRIQDPLYPHGSSIWGPSPAPNSLFSPAELATQFVIREPRRWSSSMPAGYLLVLPG